VRTEYYNSLATLPDNILQVSNLPDGLTRQKKSLF